MAVVIGTIATCPPGDTTGDSTEITPGDVRDLAQVRVDRGPVALDVGEDDPGLVAVLLREVAGQRVVRGLRVGVRQPAAVRVAAGERGPDDDGGDERQDPQRDDQPPMVERATGDAMQHDVSSRSGRRCAARDRMATT